MPFKSFLLHSSIEDMTVKDLHKAYGIKKKLFFTTMRVAIIGKEVGVRFIQQA